MKTTSRTDRRTRPVGSVRRSSTTLPLELQMIIRFCHWGEWTETGLADRYAPADALARELLARPFAKTDADWLADKVTDLPGRKFANEERRHALAALTEYFSEAKRATGCVNAVAAAEETLETLAMFNREAGFTLGLCLGYRLTRATIAQGQQ